MFEKVMNIEVDLNVEEGRGPSRVAKKTGQSEPAQISGDSPKNNQLFTVHIKYTQTIPFGELGKALTKTKDYDVKKSGEAINFLDHVLHQHARVRAVQFRKAFYVKNQFIDRHHLGSGIEVAKGVYASFRMAYMGPGPGPEVSLSVNADVSNCCFWPHMNLLDMIRKMFMIAEDGPLTAMFVKAIHHKGVAWKSSQMYQVLKKLRNLRIVLTHRWKEGEVDRQYAIKDFFWKSPHECRVDDPDNQTKDKKAKRAPPPNPSGPPPEKETIAEYYERKYAKPFFLQMPLVKLGNGNVIPVELCGLVPDQRYIHKLDDRQTSTMIVQSVTRPNVRLEGITDGVKLLEWHKDPWLQHYGISIETKRTQVKATVLPCPEVRFANGGHPAKVAQTGRWRIDGKRFIRTNADFTNAKLRNWGVCVINTGRGCCVSQQEAKRFIDSFIRLYKSHGGVVTKTNPTVVPGQICEGGEFIAKAYKTTGNEGQADPEIMFFIVPDKNTDTYTRIKKSCDCRFGVASQVVLAQHVVKCSDQYISNVCMKVNAKLGGATSRAVGSVPVMKKFPLLGGGTMIIGADVSHAAPGADSPSIASITMSMDKEFTRYIAQVENNGLRNEIISTSVMKALFKKMMEEWMKVNEGRIPMRILYFRDGVSNEMMSKVLYNEVRDINNAIKERIERSDIPTKFTVVVCTKRHHIRFFPDMLKRSDSDQNGNPLPGTIVETGCTDPLDFDWYCCAHVAIKGTARPMHYHCILDQNNLDHEALQQFIFEHSFQYARSTTPVSMFPAIYYAHLASNRGKCHEDRYSLTSDKKGIAEKMVGGMDAAQAIAETRKEKAEIIKNLPTPPKDPYTTPLLPLCSKNTVHLDTKMWYI
jgi:eukaryotic translation initiation factor 2C